MWRDLSMNSIILLFPAAAVLLVFSVVVACAQTPEFPEPSGPHAVGTSYLLFEDPDRTDPFGADSSRNREMTVRVWYPAKPPGDAVPETYLPHVETLYGFSGLPPTLAELETHSYRDLPVCAATEKYPLLLFNHGWGEHLAQSTFLMEELASHGYFVFSIAHHGEAKFTVYPDGTVRLLDQANERFVRIMAEQRNPEAFAMFQRMFEAKTMEEQKSIFRESSTLMPLLLVEGPGLWAEDISFVIGAIERMNRADHPFRGRLDLDRIGVFGMSMGGIASSVHCIRDKRCSACINIDGGLYGELLEKPCSVPVMFMNSARYAGYDELFLGRAEAGGCCVTIEGSGHMNFSDLPFFTSSLPLIGTIEQPRMQLIQDSYIRAFFDEHLKGIDSDLLLGPSEAFPEVIIQVKN
jgi:hypothetical protein